jgi:hypothetical protein
MKRVLLCAALLAWSGLSAAAVYKWVDAQGKVMYGDRPPDGVKAEIVNLLGNRIPGPAARRQSDSSRSSGSSADSSNSSKPPPLKDDAKKAVAQDVAAAKAKQCADAQERYRKLIEGRHIYKEGKEGERQYLSSEEIDSERLNAKHDVDTICNSAT